MSVRVRPAEPRDAAAIVALAVAVASEPEGWLVAAGAWRTVGGERRHLRLARRSPHAVVLVAENDTGLVGQVSALRDPHPACAHVAELGLMVRRDARRQGVGSALLAAAEAWARGAGIRKLELHVFPHNLPALALYERFGYRREGYRSRRFRRGEELVDAILMAKELE